MCFFHGKVFSGPNGDCVFSALSVAQREMARYAVDSLEMSPVINQLKLLVPVLAKAESRRN